MIQDNGCNILQEVHDTSQRTIKYILPLTYHGMIRFCFEWRKLHGRPLYLNYATVPLRDRIRFHTVCLAFSPLENDMARGAYEHV